LTVKETGVISTGDGAAASRYIEARLSKFALEVIYSPKITDGVFRMMDEQNQQSSGEVSVAALRS
jgi:topoisomerase-4 subunit A